MSQQFGPLTIDPTTGAVSSRMNKNLLDPTTTVSGFIDETAGGISASSTYFTSDYIPVVPAVYSFATLARFVAYFDAAKVIISTPTNAELGQRINIPAACAFIRVTFREANRATAGVYKGDSLAAFSGVGSQANAMYVGGCADSLGGTGWQALVTAATGCTFSLDTQGGTWISGNTGSATAMCNDTRALAPSLINRALVLMGGTNDWANSVALGTSASVDQTTFYGALNVLLQKWTNKYVDARIFIVTLNYGNMPARVTSATWTDPEVNTQGLRTTDYAEAMRDRAKYWGCSVIDCSQSAGINNGNKALYITNDGNYLHHNAKGQRRIASLVAKALTDIAE
jgi:lysophospholipase L1-like esterase